MQRQNLNRIIMTLLVFVVHISAFGADKTFCKKMFGPIVELSFEPKESNRGGVEHNVLTGKATSINIKGLKKPTGFVCLAEINDPKKDKCPAGLQLDLKRTEFPVCISNIYPLTELCPDEISGYWPELKKIVCRAKKAKSK